MGRPWRSDRSPRAWATPPPDRPATPLPRARRGDLLARPAVQANRRDHAADRPRRARASWSTRTEAPRELPDGGGAEPDESPPGRRRPRRRRGTSASTAPRPAPGLDYVPADSGRGRTRGLAPSCCSTAPTSRHPPVGGAAHQRPSPQWAGSPRRGLAAQAASPLPRRGPDGRASPPRHTQDRSRRARTPPGPARTRAGRERLVRASGTCRGSARRPRRECAPRPSLARYECRARYRSLDRRWAAYRRDQRRRRHRARLLTSRTAGADLADDRA